MAEDFAGRLNVYTDRIGLCLDRTLPPVTEVPERLHEAMRYAVLNGGKRVRPLLAYASGECLGVSADKLDAPALAIELIHAFSLVHDDLPSMDDDDLRRGAPTVHRKFDEATAILAADALQPLAFGAIADSRYLSETEASKLISLIATACGSRGMTGGQSIDLSSEGKSLSHAELELMYRLKTGALIHASVFCAACLVDDLDDDVRAGLDRYAHAIGLAFQIRDDILDVEGETGVIGKKVGADERLGKATWPSLFGIDRSRRRCAELLEDGLDGLRPFGDRAQPLRFIARYIVERAR